MLVAKVLMIRLFLIEQVMVLLEGGLIEILGLFLCGRHIEKFLGIKVGQQNNICDPNFIEFIQFFATLLRKFILRSFNLILISLLFLHCLHFPKYLLGLVKSTFIDQHRKIYLVAIHYLIMCQSLCNPHIQGILESFEIDPYKSYERTRLLLL